MPSRKTHATLPALLVLMGAAVAGFDFPTPPPPEQVPPVASYDMEVRLLPEEHAVQGVAEVTWNSPAQVPVDRLLFHLYLNGFANEASTWFQGAGAPAPDHPIRPADWGWTQVSRAELLDPSGTQPVDLTGDISFLQPDDDNDEDRTVLALLLPEPVPPGGSVTVRLEFKSRLPRFRARTGYFEDFHFFAQWFPKLAVWEPEGMRGRSPGGWNAHQYHSSTEYYADYGTYDVRLTVPSGWAVGATGERQGDPQPAEGGAETHHFIQQAVHDFTWFTGARLRSETRTYEHERWRDADAEAWLIEEVGVSPEALELPSVEVSLYYPEEHAHLVDRQFRAVFESIRWFGLWYGPYPYETLTVLDPPHGGEGAGGMEYPTLMTGGAHYWSPADRQSPEMVLVHEFGHQYWYGLVGSNEFEEAWLDEGITTYATARVLDEAYGPDRVYGRLAEVPVPGLAPVEASGSFPGWSSDDWAGMLTSGLHLRPFGVPRQGVLDMIREAPWITWFPDVRKPQIYIRRQRFLTDPAAEAISRPSWRHYSHNVYRINSYDRPAETLMSLERVVGPASMVRGLRHYALTWRYRHPSAYDFTRTFEEAVGEDLDWFFDPFIFGNATVDFAVGDVKQEIAQEPLGVFFRDGERELRTAEDREARDGDPPVWESRVSIRRRGTAAVPVTILVEREGEPPIREEWDGREPFTVLRYRGGKVTRVEVDPDHTWLIDLDRRNNLWLEQKPREEELRWTERSLIWIQNLLLFYGSLT